MIDLKKTQSDLLQHLEDVAESVQHIEMPVVFNPEVVTTLQIKDKSFIEQLAARFPKEGSHIYWIEVDEPNLLIKQFKDRSSDFTYKSARDNKNADSNYVYVGSCTTTKLGNRFKQHCGWGNDQTYSLQLRKWISDDKLTFTFSYVEITNGLVAQYIEDQLHRELKPLFGKPGGNNKIKSLK